MRYFEFYPFHGWCLKTLLMFFSMVLSGDLCAQTDDNYIMNVNILGCDRIHIEL